MSNKLMSVAVAAVLVLGSIANANPSRIAAEEALNLMSKTEMGRKFADMVGVKIPKGELAVSQRQQLVKEVEAAMNARPQMTSALSELQAVSAGKSGAQLERVSFQALNNNAYFQTLVKASAGANVVDQVVGQKAAKTSQEVLSCEGADSILIPPGARKAGLLGIKCDQSLSAANKQVAVDMFTQMGADGVSSWAAEAQQMVSILETNNPLGESTPAAIRASAKQGAKTLCNNCLDCASGLRSAVNAL